MTSRTSTWLLDPMAIEVFRDDYWQTSRLLHIARGNTHYFDRRVTHGELDRLVCSTRIPTTNFNLAYQDDPLPLSTYAFGDIADPDRVLNLHRKGATIILRSIEQWSPAFAHIRCEAERVLGCQSQVNVYLTPAQEKSTPPHWDTHDLFVLQLAGSKRWRFFRSARSLPLEDERFRVGEDVVGEMTHEVVLHAGDTLFVPRGTIHEPVADSYSVHASIGIRSPRWVDVLTTALQIAAREDGSPLRRAFDVTRSTTGDEWRDACPPLPFDDDLLARAIARVVEGQRRSRWTPQDGRLRNVLADDVPAGDARFLARGGSAVACESVAEGLQVTAGAERAVFPCAMAPALHMALSGSPFSVSDLPATDDDQRLALCVALREIGVLRAVEDTA